MEASLREHEELVGIAEIGNLTELERAIDRHWTMNAKRTQCRFRSCLKQGAEPRNGDDHDSNG